MTNPMLTWYPAGVLDDVPKRMSLDPAYERASDLTFRGPDGSWWRPQRDGSWICRESDGWARNDRPAALEGVTPLPMGITAPLAATEDRDQGTTPADPVAALAQEIARIADRYRDGAMVSTMAELALADMKLITTDGSLWTVGAQSQSWYQYGRDGWELHSQPPPESILSGEDARAVTEATDGALQLWADQGPYLPETIAPEWSPPPPPDSIVAETPTTPPPPPPPPRPEGWDPTHVVPSTGMQAWGQPDPSAPAVADLAAGVRLSVGQRRGDWAQVRAENGWEGWVDGRRLIAAGPPLSEQPPTAPPSTETGEPATADTTDRDQSDKLAGMQRDPWLIGASAALLLTTLLPWRNSYSFGDDTSAFSVPVAFLFDYQAEPEGIPLGVLVILIGAVAVASLFDERVRRYRRIAAWIGVAASVLFLVQSFQFLNYDNGDVIQSLTDLVNTDRAIGPWIALAASGILVWKS